MVILNLQPARERLLLTYHTNFRYFTAHACRGASFCDLMLSLMESPLLLCVISDIVTRFCSALPLWNLAQLCFDCLARVGFAVHVDLQKAACALFEHLCNLYNYDHHLVQHLYLHQRNLAPTIKTQLRDNRY